MKFSQLKKRASKFLKSLLLLFLLFSVLISPCFAEVCLENDWCWENPLPMGIGLIDILVSDYDELYTVSSYGTILHYDGNSWSIKEEGLSQLLSAAWNFGSDDIYAVSAGYPGKIFHYNGISWSEVEVNINGSLAGIWSSGSNDVYVVGGSIFHFNGTSWSEIPIGPHYGLYGVWGSGPSDVYAVGDMGTILHFDGTSWTSMTSGTTQTLTAVWGSGSNDVYAGGAPGIILHYDGISWSEVEVNVPEFLNSIWGSGSNDVYAVGYSGTILHYDGISWSVMDSGTTQALTFVRGGGFNDVYAVGKAGIILYYDGTSWSALSSGVYQSLADIWGVGVGDVYAVGDMGTILHFDGTSWTSMTSGTTQTLTAVWGSESNDVYAVGRMGTILHFDGTSWTSMTSGTTQTLAGVWGSGSNDVYAVDYSGTILHFDGTSWTSMTSGTTQFLFEIWGSGPSDVYAVGSYGTILHYDGTSWTSMTSGTTETLNGVWGSGSNNIYAVGGSGTILHFDGTSWTSNSTGTPQPFTGIWGSGSNDIYTVGFDSFHYDGTSWSPLPNLMRVWSVWGSDANDVFAVGSSGEILHYRTWRYVIPKVNGNGSIVPETLQTVMYGDTASFTINPDPWHHIESITGCDGSLEGNIYTTSIINSDCTVTASFVINSYTVTPSAGANGNISPVTPQAVAHEDTVSFTVNPNSGYHIESITGCGGALNDNIYTTGPITKDCSVSASFSNLHTVTPSAGENGNISPMTQQSVTYGDTVSFTITPDPGYHIDGITGTCSGTLSDNIYTTVPITKDCSVYVGFSNLHTVTPSSGANGSISPELPQSVAYGDTAYFFISPDLGYHIESVTGCGGALSDNVYFTSPITEDCTVAASFAISSYTVTPSSGANGNISPEVPQSVVYPDTVSFTITPDVGYYIESVTGCGGTLVENTYITGPITKDCSISTSFSNIYTVTPSSGTGGSITPETPQSVVYGDTVSFTVTPDSGYHTESITGCGGTLTENTYTTGPITGDCSVVTNFSNTFTVTSSVADGNGNITPNGEQEILNNTTAQFVLTPDPGYFLDSVTGTCGGTLFENTFTTYRVTEDCTVVARFAQHIFSLSTTEIENYGWIPDKHTGIGDDLSPAISWVHPPVGTQSLVLIVKDINAVDPFWGDDWKHWIVYDISSSISELPENSGAEGATNLPNGAKHGVTSWWEANFRPGNYYQGPLPTAGSGEHRYVFQLIALEIAELSPLDDTGYGPSYHQLATAMQGHILGSVEIVGRYGQDPYYMVTPSVVANGTIAPATAQPVTESYAAQFEIIPDAGYYIESVTGTCGGNLSGNIFVTNPISNNCDIVAAFRNRCDPSSLSDTIKIIQVIAGLSTSGIIMIHDINDDNRIGLEEAIYALRYLATQGIDTDDDGDGFSEQQGDCNDSDSNIYPGAEEVCGDGVDQNCNCADLNCSQ